MTTHFTATELADLSAQVDAQLGELDNMVPTTMRGAKSALPPDKPPTELPPKQRKDIEETAQEEADHFLVKLTDTAKHIFCNADSDLQKRYGMFGNLKKDELLEKLAGGIAVLGFSGIALHILSVAIAVYILHIGVKAFSSKYCQ
ncbi:MAG: hypothetical protein DRR19_25650 [Candidatus Parabeggiatoa sp. nov. 1]|nr:MAG: hypothetical protein DRR19_25650 [Gammaproteobacteria bacterium]